MRPAVVGPRSRKRNRLAFLRARVVDRVIFDVLRQRLAVVDKLLQLGVGDVAGHDNGAVKAQAGGDRMCRQLRRISLIG